MIRDYSKDGTNLPAWQKEAEIAYLLGKPHRHYFRRVAGKWFCVICKKVEHGT